MKFNLKNFPKDDDKKYDGLMHATWEAYSEDVQQWKEGFEAELREIKERGSQYPEYSHWRVRKLIREILGE